MVERRTVRRWSFTLVALGGSLAILFAPDLLPGDLHAQDARLTLLARIASIAAALAWAAYFAMAAFRSADEFIQERAKFSWYWGSFIGLALATPLAACVMLGGARWLSVGASVDPLASRAFGAGAAFLLAAQVLGSAAVSIWWKGTRR